MNAITPTPDVPTAAPAVAVRMVDISKRFGPVLANGDVNLRVLSGTVHGLVGENGATARSRCRS